MRSRSLQILTVSSWAALAVCAAALFYLAIAIPNVFSAGSAANRNTSVEEIRASSNFHEVQQIAVWRTQEESYIMRSSRVLLIVAVAALLVCMICSFISVRQAGRMKGKAGS